MEKIKIKFDEVTEDVVGEDVDFPKYTTQILNLANQNSQATRPNVVGQMSELIQEFDGKTYEEWVEWYSKKKPGAIKKATEKVYSMTKNLKDATGKIDKELVNEWIKDLVLTKTFVGFRFQESILKRVAEEKDTSYKLSTPEEESKGIDGYIGETPVSIKPTTYKTKNMLREDISVGLIFYDKKKSGIVVEFDL